jgi:hypothetical protein
MSNKIALISVFLGLPDPDPLVRGTDKNPALKIMNLRVSYKKQIWKIIIHFAALKSLKKIWSWIRIRQSEVWIRIKM